MRHRKKHTGSPRLFGGPPSAASTRIDQIREAVRNVSNEGRSLRAGPYEHENDGQIDDADEERTEGISHPEAGPFLR